MQYNQVIYMPIDCVLLNLGISGYIRTFEKAKLERRRQFYIKHAGSNNLVGGQYA